jgi:antitoxin HigA-1
MTLSCPCHPGKILKERFLDPLGITPYRLAKDIGVPTRRVSELVKGHRRLSVDTAIRLGLFFDVPPAWWLAMQARFDTESAPLIDKLRESVTKYAGLGSVLVTPHGVHRLEPSHASKPGVILVQVPDDLMRRLKAQVALESPRASRQALTVTYPDGSTALVGRDR